MGYGAHVPKNLQQKTTRCGSSAADGRSRRGASRAHDAKTWAKPDRRYQLTAAALRLFSRHPYEEVSVDDIAGEAGVAHGLVSYYFGGKREMYLAALEMVQKDLRALTQLEMVQEDLRALTQPLPSDGDVTAQIKGAVRRHFEYFQAHPQLVTVVSRSPAPTPQGTVAPTDLAPDPVPPSNVRCARPAKRQGKLRQPHGIIAVATPRTMRRDGSTERPAAAAQGDR